MSLAKKSGAILVRVIVRSVSGEPLQDARVYCERAPVPMPDIAALTIEDGEVLLAAPSPGTYRFVVSANGFQNHTIEVTVDDEAEVSLTPVLNPIE